MDPRTELLEISLSILGVSSGATFEEVQYAYRSEMKKWHPDLHMGSEHKRAQASEVAKGINAAYDWIQSNRSFFDSWRQKREQAIKSSIVVNKFLFGEDWIEEGDVDRPIDIIQGVDPQFPVRLADAKGLIPLMEGLAHGRNYRYFWCDKLTGLHRQPIRSRVDFSRRHVAINMSLNPRIKLVWFAGAFIFFRDLLRYGTSADRKLILGALSAAGWNGDPLFQSKKYFESEALICGEFSGRYLLTDRGAGSVPEGKMGHWFKDFSAHLSPKSMADYARVLANRFRFDAHRSLAYPFLVDKG